MQAIFVLSYSPKLAQRMLYDQRLLKRVNYQRQERQQELLVILVYLAFCDKGIDNPSIVKVQ